MAMAIVRRRFAGFVKVKAKKKAPLPRRPSSSTPDTNEQMVGDAAVVRVYAPRAAVGRAVEAKPWWHGLWKPLAIGGGVAVGCLIAFLIMKAPARSPSGSSVERPEYPRSVSLSHSRVVGAAAARNGAAGPTGAGHVGGSDEVILSNRAAQTDDSFRASGYVRKAPEAVDGVAAPARAKVYLPEASGSCVVGGGRDFGDCLRQQAGQ